MTGPRIERVVTSGVFTLDGQSFDVDNNIWLVGDDEEVMVIDAAHSASPILDAVGSRRLSALVCTHGHNDHVNAAEQVVEASGAPVYLHPADTELWQLTNPSLEFLPLADGDVFDVAGTTLQILHTPGHSPGGVCLHMASQRKLFSGDTLFNGGPGATGRSFSDRPTLLRSIETRLLGLAPETVVRTGHGDDTTIGAEAARF